MKAYLLVTVVLSLGGCASATPQYDADAARFDSMTPCEQAAELLGYPSTGYALKQAVLEKARNMRCFGAPQPQTVIIK